MVCANRINLIGSRDRRRNLIFRFGVLQETRLTNIPPNIGDWWGRNDCCFEFFESIGRSGGMICFWDRSLFQVLIVVKSRHFMAVMGYWNGIVGETIFVNV